MNSTTTKLLSMIIPTKNHAQLVSDLLDTLAVQVPVSFRWEVMVIDNGSIDQTAKIPKEKISSLPIEIRYIYEPRPGLHNGAIGEPWRRMEDTWRTSMMMCF